MLDKLKLAVIGCGAVARIYHLPTIALSNDVNAVALVDKVPMHAGQLAEKYNIPIIEDDYRKIIGQIDAAIVALPNHLHAPVTIGLLQNGIHVLVEKPMALKVRECDKIIETAHNTHTTLAVGLDFRFFESSRFVKQVVKKKLLGNIISFDLRQGLILKWPASSDYLFQKERAGGGVLIDFGVHILDLLLWWLGDYEGVEYYDDSMGGVEADCVLRLWLECGASGIVELSRTRTLRNTCIIYGEYGTLEVGMWDPDPVVRLTLIDQDFVLTGRVTQDKAMAKTFRDVFRRQLDDFVQAIRQHREPFIPGQEGKRAVRLIEACYATRQLLQHPWMFPTTYVHGMLDRVSI
jgi:predicted dehydrogenase